MTQEQPSKQEGVVSAHPKGFGFATCDDASEYFIAPPLMRELLPGDRIRFDIAPGRAPGTWQAANPQVTVRPESVWVGTLRQEQGAWLLEPDEPCFIPIEVRELQFAAEGQVVCVRVRGFVSTGARATKVQASLERLLGTRDRAGFDNDYALARYDFEPYFHASVLAQCRTLNVPTQGRRDLTAVPFVTIDGESTRDFDDAVWAQATPTGWRVQVAIADVSHYVSEGSVLDKAAARRATSVYLPGKTVPMLPEVLSNGVCSLVPQQDRLAVVLDIVLDAQCQVQTYSFERAVIRSAQRLTYTQVDAWRKGKELLHPSVDTSLSAMWQVYEQLAALRQARGQLSFEDREPKLDTMPDGTTRLGWSLRNDAHKLVEELMLLANQCAARRLRETTSKALFRHQPAPDADDWLKLKEWATTRGVQVGDAPTMAAMCALVGQAQGEDVLKAQLQVRNGMQPAVYDEHLPSHYSLGYEAYTHFTSPLRRYADLLVHRLLLGESTRAEEALSAVVARCSQRSRDARMAERWVGDRIKKHALAKHVSPEAVLEAHVVSQSRRGLRVVATQWQCSLLVDAQELQTSGCRFDDAAELWHNGAQVLETGTVLPVMWLRLEQERARAELYARLALPENV